MKYKDYFNFELGNRDIYSHNDILGMTVQDLFDQELPLSYQYNTIGIPKDDELKASPNTHQYTNANGKLRWRSSSKTTEELLEEERQRRLAQEAQLQMTQSQLGAMSEPAAPIQNVPETEEIPMTEDLSEPDSFQNALSNLMDSYVDRINRGESFLPWDKKRKKQPDDTYDDSPYPDYVPTEDEQTQEAEDIEPVDIEPVAEEEQKNEQEPNYYEENLPVDNLDEDEIWDNLRKEIKHFPKEQELLQTPHSQLNNEFQEMSPNGKTLLKGIVEESVDPYQLIQEDSTLSVEEKVARIKELSDLRTKEIEKEYRKNMSRILAGGALEVGSYFIPGTLGAKAVGGLTKAMAPIAKGMAPVLGKKVANDVVKNIAEGAVSAPISAIGESMVTGEGLDEILPEVEAGMKQNALFSGYIWTKKQKKADELKKIDNFDNLSKYQKRRMQDKYMQYYDDYVEGTVKYKTPKPRPSHQLRTKEWIEWLKKAKLRKW